MSVLGIPCIRGLRRHICVYSIELDSSWIRDLTWHSRRPRGRDPSPRVLSVVKLDELGVGVEQVCANRGGGALDSGKVGGHGCCGCCGCCCELLFGVSRFLHSMLCGLLLGSRVRWFNFYKKGIECLSPWFFWVFCFVDCESLVGSVALGA